VQPPAQAPSQVPPNKVGRFSDLFYASHFYASHFYASH
jgi:hypothetical protein